MSNRVSLSPRDLSMLRLLSWTPATTSLLLQASSAFDGGPFADERRLRERLRKLNEAGFVRSWSTAHAGGGLENYYKLTSIGFATMHGPDVRQLSHAYFAEVSPALFAHTFRLSKAIIETVRACHHGRVTIERFMRENELALEVGDQRVQPDCFFRLKTGGRSFQLAFEIDNSTASVDSFAVNSVRQKLVIYNSYQDKVLAQWLAAGKKWERPRFRVVFLTHSVERAYHILSFAADAARNQARRLIYAATLESFVSDADPLFAPIFLDHFGDWQALIDLHPTARFQKSRVRLVPPLESLVSV